jgi:hypothetical protein
MSDLAGLPPVPAPCGDADLVTASRSGDAMAYATLSQRHATAVRRIAEDRHRPAASPHFSASLGGLAAGRAVRVKAVRWTAAGPQESAFTRPSVGHPAVSFTAGRRRTSWA